MKKIFLTFLAMVAMVGMVNAQRAWAYDLALAQEAEAYTFTFKATTAANATLIFTDVEGTELAAVELGAVEAGLNTKTLAASELPQGKKVNWAVKMAGEAITELAELTDESKGIYNFYLPQGVAVDNNPESAAFGTIYVAEATDGASDGGSDRADTQKRGIFIYDQELNELNPTSNVGIIPSNVTLGVTTRQAMKRLAINPLTNEVAFAHNADPMAVWAVPAENVGGEAKNLIEGLGFTNVNSICFTEDGTLYVLESNGYPAPGSLYKVVDGVVDTLFANYNRFGNGDNALVSDNRGGIWICQNRGQLDTYNQLTHVNAAGEIDFEVNTATPNGFESKNTARGTIAYNPAEDILAMSLSTEGGIGASLYQVAYDETTGVPSLTFITSTPALGTNVDGLAFDYAGDLYGLSANKERLYKFVVPTDNNVCVVPAAAKHAFEIEAAPAVEIVGVVKRALQLGESVVVLTHEADGTPHIYNVVGETITEVSQEGVIACDPENAGDLLAISDIAATEDGKLVAVNQMICQADASYVDAGYKRGENRFYIWNTLTENPTIWFKSNQYANWFRSNNGYTMAIKGTSTDATIALSGYHATKSWARIANYKVIDGVYTEPANSAEGNECYTWCEGTAAGDIDDNVIGKKYELNASPLAAENWIVDGDSVNPIEYTTPAEIKAVLATVTPVSVDLGKKYNGATYVTMGEQALMVAPYADAEGKLAGVKVLDITAGLASATEVAVANLDAAVEATTAATAVAVDGELLTVTLVADATLHTLVVGDKPAPAVVEDTITNLVFDYESTAFIGGPSEAYQVEVFLVLGEDKLNGTWTLSEETAIAVDGEDAIFIEGTVSNIDLGIPAADAVIVAEVGGQLYEFHLNMIGGAPEDAIVIEVADANIKVNKSLQYSDPIMGDMYEYSLTITADWTYAEDGLTYPILVEVPVYYPEATEPSDILCAVTVGNIAGNWLGFAEGDLTITTAEGVVTVKGIVANSGTGVAFDLTISGKLPVESAVDNVVVDGNIVKTFENGQLVIIKNGVKVNASGAVVK